MGEKHHRSKKGIVVKVKILITGAAGFVGRNLSASLEAVRDGKDRTLPQLKIDKLYLYDLDSSEALLDEACAECDFVFNLAGVNRPTDPADFIAGNLDFAEKLLSSLERHGNTCPVMLASSIQATLEGRYNGDYGRSKRKGEDLFFAYAERTGAKVLVYRFPNLFGKWCRPNYNSAVATFCYNIANDLPITVTDPGIRLRLLYIDDLVCEMKAALLGCESRCSFDGVSETLDHEGLFCTVPVTHEVTLGEITELLYSFAAQPRTLELPHIPEGSFAKKLYSTYLSYLPYEKVAFPLKMNCDSRGSFTEILKCAGGGQFSVNVSKPGVTKGMHWHNTKWEFFVVVSGKALIRQRRLGSDEVISFEVTGDEIKAVHMLPGYTHDITNLSDRDDLVTLMWANESFDRARPDTFFEEVVK